MCHLCDMSHTKTMLYTLKILYGDGGGGGDQNETGDSGMGGDTR